MKPTDKKQTPEHCKLLYSKDFYTASNFYPKFFSFLKNCTCCKSEQEKVGLLKLLPPL